ncbi:helix-turn-helix domain-containing protein [Saxibacter everestensis]|uniref:Helix-turn-helix domain-containing protein n=1 Tax=Saxibacter everestensis TaxID=2909229 RepID=A0ABY8QS91_9MICO|nr:helix-turn-helix domain-containing protein [Brevibacteriaceae bacterium ZFBP1038]
MQDLPQLKLQTLDRWRELVQDLQGDIGRLLDTFLESLADNSPYTSGLVTPEDITESGVHSFQLLLAALLSDDEVPDFGVLPTQLGRRRARQGVPAENLVAAVRLDFKIIWASLLRRATTDDMPVLSVHVERVWQVVDEYARQVQHSYLTERAIMAQEERSQQERYVALLFGSQGRLPEQLRQIALSLKVDSFSDFRVCAASGPAATSLRHAAHLAAERGQSCYVHEQGVCTVAFWPVTNRPGGPGRSNQDRFGTLDERIPGLAQVACADIPVVRGLAAVPAAAEQAAELLPLLTPEDRGPRQLRSLWQRVAKRRLDDVGNLSSLILGGLDTCTGDERERLIETVRAYLRFGNIAETAQASYCHRNTVLNRLRRFEDLTDINVTVPNEAALAVVLLS